MSDIHSPNDLFETHVVQDNKVQLKTVETTQEEAESKEKTAPKVAANRKGRPRSEKSRKSILKATNSLLLHQSVQELSIEGIAKKAKVGKTTIYRWWPNKTAIVMDALMDQPGITAPMKTPTNNAEAVEMQLEKLIKLLHSKNGETIAQLFSEAQTDDKALKIFEGKFLSPLIDAIEYSIEEGQDAGEFNKTLNKKMATDMVCGPIFFRLLSRPADMNTLFQTTYPRQAVKLISA